MKRRKPLTSGTPLTRKTGLRRTGLRRGASLPNGPVKVRRQKDTGPARSVKDMVKARAAVDDVELCEVCGLVPGSNIHHRQPRGVGGSSLPYINAASNLLWVCGHGNAMPGCHGDIENDRDHAKRVGWLVPRPTMPVGVPVLRRGVLVLLTDDGSFEPYEGKVA